MNKTHDKAREWFHTNWPYVVKIDIDWTTQKYEYPDYVVEWIKSDTNDWHKISDDCGGTYENISRKMRYEHLSRISESDIHDNVPFRTARRCSNVFKLVSAVTVTIVALIVFQGVRNKLS